MGNYKIFLGLFGFCALSVSAGAALAATAGHVQFINGNVQITDSSGLKRPMQKGDAINEGDTVITAKGATAQIKMQDGGFIAVRQDTQLKLDSFKFAGRADGTENSLLSLLRGGFRAVTGLIGRVNKQNYRVTTTAATIGIRGTDYEVLVTESTINVAMAGLPSWQEVQTDAPMLLAQLGTSGANQTAAAIVNVGKIAMETNMGTALLSAGTGNMLISHGMNRLPQTMPMDQNLFPGAGSPPPKEAAGNGQSGKNGGNGQTQEGSGGSGGNGKKEEGDTSSSSDSSGEVRATAVTDNTSTTGTVSGASTATAAPTTDTDTALLPPPIQEAVPTVMVDSSTGNTLNTTTQSVTSSTGQQTSIQNGTYDVQAQAAASAAATAAGATDFTFPADVGGATTAVNNATTAKNNAATAVSGAATAVNALTAPSTAAAATAVNSATTAVNNATSAVNALAAPSTTAAATAVSNATTSVNNATTAVNATTALSIDTALASSNALAAGAAASTAATLATNAQTALTANGIFADSTAGTANAVTQSANTLLQTANTNAQTAATGAATSNSSLAAAKTAASSALTTASSSLSSANTNLATANTQAGNYTNAQTAASSALTTASSSLATANTSLATANTEAGNYTTAQAAASSALTTANSSLTTANTSLVTANSNLSAASTQLSSLTTALTSLGTLILQNPTVLSGIVVPATLQQAVAAAQAAAAQATTLQAAGDFNGAQIAMQAAQHASSIVTAALAVDAALANVTTAVSSVNTSAATASSQAGTASSQASTAATAATNATAAASSALTTAGTASTDAGTASSQASTAATAATAANTAAAVALTAANTASTDATTASSQATTAQSAATTGATDVATTTSELAVVNTNAPIVTTNAPVAAYSNPAIDTTLGGNDGFGHWALATNPAPKEEFIAQGSAHSQTNYVLDGNKNLIEIRDGVIDGNGYNYFNPVSPIFGANIKLSGGAAYDHFQFADNTGYMGRWRGGNIDVNGSPYIALGLPGTPGTTSIHWGIFLSPSAGYVQNLTGTANYTLVASTHPTDSFGNTGTLNSAYINANFTNQTVDTGVNLSFSTADAVNISTKNMAFAASATSVPIAGSGFDASPAGIGTLVFGCTGTDCDPNGYQGDIVGQFVGADAVHAALGYSIHALVPSATAGQPHTDLIHGMAAFNTATAPIVLPTPLTVAGNPPVWTNLYSYEVVAASGVPGAYNIVNPFGSSLANTVYGLDAANNLLEINRPVSTKEYFTGGTAQNTWTSAGNTIYMGRWQGGSLTTIDYLGQPTVGSPVALGAGSAHWIVSANTPLNYAQSLIGTANYTLAAATAPTDALGNTGSLLNTSTITADFTTQLVNMALNVQFAGARSSVFTVSTPGGIPIGGDTIWGGGTVTCTGTCDAGGYSSNLWGRFAGATASEVALAYHIDATSSADIIQGAAAFATATAPTVLTGGPFAAYAPNHVAVEFASSIGWWWDSLLVEPFNLTYGGGGLSSLLAQDFGCCQTQTFSVIGGATPVTANAASFSTTGIEFGRWTSVTALENTHTEPLGQFGWGGRQAWMYGPMGYLDPGITAPPVPGPAGQMYGTFSYALDASTAPFDRQSRQKGTLTGASISADFVAQTVIASIALNVGGQYWSASTSAPVFFGNGSQFFASSYPGGASNNLVVSVGAGAPAACPTCYGSLGGAFTGQNYAGAILSYNLWDNGNLGGDVSGNAALVRTGAAVSNGSPQTVLNYFVAESGSGSGANIQVVDTLNPSAQPLNPGGVLTSYSAGSPAVPANFYFSSTASCTGCTASSTANTPNTGIYFGAWDAGSFTSTWGGGIGSSSPHWITGPEAGPLFLSQALIGTKTFAFDGGMVTNSIGVPGTVQGTTSLTVDFTRQMVDINIDLAVNDTSGSPHTWSAQTLPGNEAPIQGGNGIGGATFHASSYDSSFGTGLLTVMVDGTTPGNGNVSGQLTGAGLNGAIMSFDLNANLPSPAYFQQVSGVAALVAPNQAGAPGGVSDVATPYRWVMTSLTTPDSITKSHVLGIYANDPARMSFSGGNLTKFDMNWIDDRGKGSSETVAINITTPPVLANAGNDPVTGISWGRWAGGSGDSMDRVTGVTTTHPLAGSLHWIAAPVATAPVTLPVSGTFTYTNAGGTAPTDNLGNVGTLNSATLQANFTAQTVNMGVNVSVGGTTLNASAANAPIIQKTAFWAGSNAPVANPSHLAVTCSAGCGTAHQGTIVGGFGGVGATGAMMSYGLEKISGASTQVISGVVGFHR